MVRPEPNGLKHSKLYQWQISIVRPFESKYQQEINEREGKRGRERRRRRKERNSALLNPTGWAKNLVTQPWNQSSMQSTRLYLKHEEIHSTYLVGPWSAKLGDRIPIEAFPFGPSPFLSMTKAAASAIEERVATSSNRGSWGKRARQPWRWWLRT